MCCVYAPVDEISTDKVAELLAIFRLECLSLLKTDVISLLNRRFRNWQNMSKKVTARIIQTQHLHAT